MMADILEGNIKQSKTDYDIVIRETKPRFLQVASEETFAREASFAMQAILHGNAAEALQKCSKQSRLPKRSAPSLWAMPRVPEKILKFCPKQSILLH